jgi:hypothetical protein
MQSFIEVELTKLHNWRTLTQLRRQGKPGPESSLIKLFWSEMSQRLHDTAMDVLAIDGQLLWGDPRAVARGRWPRSYMYYRAASIFAGTNEIQRNIRPARGTAAGLVPGLLEGLLRNAWQSEALPSDRRSVFLELHDDVRIVVQVHAVDEADHAFAHRHDERAGAHAVTE